MFATTMILKLISFHHVMHDVRYLCKKIIKAKNLGLDVDPAKIEEEFELLPKTLVEIAITYPKCLKFSNFFRFLISPTFCY